MIKGYATEDATEAFAQQHHPLSVGNIGTTGLTVSQAGFGCYRVSTGVAHHQAALKSALGEGINLIDTSSNYADVLAELRRPIKQDGRLESWRVLAAEIENTAL